MCKCFARCCAAVHLAVLGLLLAAVHGEAADPDAKAANPRTTAVRSDLTAANAEVDAPRRTSVERIEAALARKVTFDLHEQPLGEIVQKIAKEHDINFRPDKRNLEEAGIDLQTPVTFKAREISLRSALRLMLSPLDCTITIQDEVLQVVTSDLAETQLITRCYGVKDLLAATNAFGERVENFEPLRDLLISSLAPLTWDEVGGPGAISIAGDTLIVSQTMEVHRQLADLLRTLRTARDVQDKPLPTSLRVVDQNSSESEYKTLLARRVTWRFNETPLGEAVESITKETRFNIRLDVKALEEASVDAMTPVSLDVSDVSLAAALRLLLRPMELDYHFRHEVLVITTVDKCNESLSTRIYPVGDLLGVTDATAMDGDYDSLIESIITTIHPTTWDEAGGPSRAVPFPPVRSVVISQTAETLDEIDTLIESLRANRLAAAQPEKLITMTYNLTTIAPHVMAQPAAKVETKPSPEKSASPATAVESAGQPELPNAVCATTAQPALPASAVVGLIEEKVFPDSWSKDAKIRVVGDKLVITQTAAAHRRIALLMAVLKNGDAHSSGDMSGSRGFGGGFFAVPTRSRGR